MTTIQNRGAPYSGVVMNAGGGFVELVSAVDAPLMASAGGG
jgi:hypothetical protein